MMMMNLALLLMVLILSIIVVIQYQTILAYRDETRNLRYKIELLQEALDSKDRDFPENFKPFG